MSIENINRLKKISTNFSLALREENDEIGDKLFNQTSDDLDDIIKTSDEDILPALMDLFTLHDLDYTGICESLEGDIFKYFSWEQILHALREKFPKLIEMNIDRAVHFAGACISRGYFYEFRKIFNELPKLKSYRLFNKLYSWVGNDFPEEIAILREDMKNWK